jgi:hypothetical protein
VLACAVQEKEATVVNDDDSVEYSSLKASKNVVRMLRDSPNS